MPRARFIAMGLTILDHKQDHVLISTTGAARFEISLVTGRVVIHGYKGTGIDQEQEPDITYDGTEHATMENQYRSC